MAKVLNHSFEINFFLNVLYIAKYSQSVEMLYLVCDAMGKPMKQVTMYNINTYIHTYMHAYMHTNFLK